MYECFQIPLLLLLLLLLLLFEAEKILFDLKSYLK